MSKYAKRTDKNQAQIVDELRLRGFQVVVTNWGGNFPDLLVGARGRWRLMEIKQPGGSLDRGQMEFLAKAKGSVAVVTDSEEALNCVIYDMGVVSQQGQTELDVWLRKNPTQESLSVRKFRKLVEIKEV